MMKLHLQKVSVCVLVLSALMTSNISCGSDTPSEPSITDSIPTINDNGQDTTAAPSTVVTYNLPDREIRGVWVATVSRIDWPNANVESAQKEEFIKYLELFRKYNVNAVIMQVRPCADAFYDSPLEPWSEYITGKQGKDPGYDVLQWLIDETHAYGMEFHAWMNPYRVSNSATTFYANASADHPAKLHPEWTMTYDNLLMYRPALPEVKQLLIDVVDDIISKYDIDGIHFDDYFYPYPKSGFSIDDADDYATYGSGYSNIGDFRRAQVDDVIERIHKLIQTKKPGVVFSISPYGIWRNRASDPVNGSESSGLQNYDDLYADVRRWCQEGWIDLVVPQLYNSTTNIAMNFTTMCKWWNTNHFNAKLAIGHALYRFGVEAEGAPYQTLDQLSDQFSISRGCTSTCGSFLYNATAFKDNKINILSRLAQVYINKAIIPEIGILTEPEVKMPENVNINGYTLTWTPQSNACRYAIYSVTATSKTGVYNSKLVDVTTSPTYTVSTPGNYAISAINRDNVESTLTQPIRII
jgi:uncharacterized lipoprotein YddW (UPF0748 family)